MKFDFNLIYKNLYISSKKLVLTFEIEYGLENDGKPSEKEFKEKITKKIPLNEREFLKIKSVSKKEVKIEFDEAKWFKKGCSDTVQQTADRFVKRIKISKMPSMITANAKAVEYTKFIEGAFRTYLEKNTKLKKNITSSIKQTAIKSLSISCFKYEYDSYFNSIRATLKPEFQINPMLLATLKEETEIPEQQNFDRNVKTYLKLIKYNK